MPGGPHIAIIGAGFSGSLLALHLLKAGPPDLRISLIERAPGFGRGLAYGTQNPRHLLNVRVGNMSAWPEDPGHLERWLAGRPDAEGGPASFISRETYGLYLASMLHSAISRPDGAHRLVLEHDEAVALQRRAGRLSLTLAMGRTLEADALVLALGHLPPGAPAGVGFESLPAHLYAPDPWTRDALEDIPKQAAVLLLGTGLTMVDVAISLERHGHSGPVLALSRRGLLPRRHYGSPAPSGCRPMTLTAGPLSHRLAGFRRRAEQIGWRSAVDEMRPLTQAIWRAASLEERRRFLRHLRPWWDVHRHRLAPSVADWLFARLADGSLAVRAGRIQSVEAHPEGAQVTWRGRGAAASQHVRVARIINCTGPGDSSSAVVNPLLRSLFESGVIRTDALGLGLDVLDDGRVVGAGGQAADQIFAVGPLTRGSSWEVIAVPDIRSQVADLAHRMTSTLAVALPT